LSIWTTDQAAYACLAGESEASLTGIFSAAAALSPSIVFIDEVDALAPSRDGTGQGGASSHTAAAGGSSGSSAAGEAAARVLTQLLVLMDGLGSSSGKAKVSGSSLVAGSSSSSKAGVSDSSAVPGSSTQGAAAGGGVQAATDTRVVVIAATNRPSAVDPALRRPGRWVGVLTGSGLYAFQPVRR
jgi:SpoVK/Ycf46/Vps4 family AAA+-type ATPase